MPTEKNAAFLPMQYGFRLDRQRVNVSEQVYMTAFVLQKNMEAVKVEPDSDDETHRTSSQNEYCVTNDKDNYPVRAELFIVKDECEVSFHIHHYLFDYLIVLYCHVHVVCCCIWSVVCFLQGRLKCPIMSRTDIY